MGHRAGEVTGRRGGWRTARGAAAGALLVQLACAGATYHDRSFVFAMPEETVEARSKPKQVQAGFSDDFDAEVARMYARGFELVGYAQFTSALVPRFAERNARMTAKKRRATHALLAQPTAAKLNQRRYLTTFWRPADRDAFVLGAYYADMPGEASAALGCERNLVVVWAVVPGTPAERMGLQKGDLIRTIDGTPLPHARVLDDALVERRGRDVTLDVVRGEEAVRMEGRLADPPGFAPPAEVEPEGRAGLELVKGGLSLDLRRVVDEDEGVFVRGVVFNSPACFADFRAADLILRVDGKGVDDPESVAKRIRKADDGPIEVEVVRALERRTMNLDLAMHTSEAARARRRLDLPESRYGEPWINGEHTDWTWLTITGNALAAGAEGYAAAVAEQRRRQAEAYAAAQAQYQAAPHSYTDRNGNVMMRTSGGSDYVRVNAETAALMRNNPGYTLSTSRRGRVELYDSGGSRIRVPGNTFRPPTAAYVPPNLKYGPSVTGLFDGYAGMVNASNAFLSGYDFSNLDGHSGVRMKQKRP